MPDGRRKLLREFNVSIEGRKLCIPNGFVTDYSSWPRALPGPNYQRIDVAGVVHDFLFKYGTWGIGGSPVSFIEANRIWFVVARAGDDANARANYAWALMGRSGLFVGAWPTWLRYRRQ